MPSDIDQLLEDFGAPVLDDSFGVSVVLKRGVQSSEAFTATWTDQKYEALDSEGQLAVVVQSRDFVFAVSDAAINGTAITPRSGDRLIVEGTETFELMPVDSAMDKASPVAEKLPGNYRWLVHTKKVA